jgi:hypothetical protein
MHYFPFARLTNYLLTAMAIQAGRPAKFTVYIGSSHSVTNKWFIGYALSINISSLFWHNVSIKLYNLVSNINDTLHLSNILYI